MPVINAFDGREPASIVENARELLHPRPAAGRGAFCHPEPDLRLALHRVLPPIRLLQAHAENPADRSSSHDGPVLLGAAAVAPRRRHAAPRLVVGELNRRHVARGLHVRRAIWNEPRRRIRGAYGSGPTLPQIGAAPLWPG